MVQRRYPFKKLHLVIIGLLVLIIFLYLSGGLSFARRILRSADCLISESRICNRLISLSGESRLLNRDLEQGQSEPEIFSQRVVLAGINKDELLVWSMSGLVARYFITDKTTYGVAVSLNVDESERESHTNFLEMDELVLIDNSSHFAGEGGLILIERNPGSLTKKQFGELVKAGNLLKIVYNKNTGHLVGILVLDFKRI